MLKYDLLKALPKLSHGVFLIPLVSEFLVFQLGCISDYGKTCMFRLQQGGRSETFTLKTYMFLRMGYAHLMA